MKYQYRIISTIYHIDGSIIVYLMELTQLQILHAPGMIATITHICQQVFFIAISEASQPSQDLP